MYVLGYDDSVQQAPAWLSYASPAIALLALFISFATYRRGGPRVRVTAYAPSRWNTSDPDLKVTLVVQNSGLAPVQIVSIRLGLDYFGLVGILPSLDLKNEDRLDGPDLKAKLESGHQIEWTFDAISAMRHQFGENFEMFESTLPDLLTRRRSVGPAIRRFLLLTLALANLRCGIVAAVDLGNGVQVYSRPMYRLTLKFLPYVRRRWLNEESYLRLRRR